MLMLMAACAPPGGPAAGDDAALREAGYTPAPRFTAVTASANGFILSGEAAQSARVGITYVGINRAGQTVSTVIGLSADDNGRFSSEVPSGVQGGLYNLVNDDRGRRTHAEGRLFIPAGQPEKAVLLRPGGASTLVGDGAAMLAVADYDGAGGLALAGKVAPDTTVDLTVDAVIIGQARSDETGRYRLTAQIPAPSDESLSVMLEITAGGQHVTRALPLSRPVGADRITRTDQGWRVDWNLPGGGIQTTVVF